MKKKLFVLSIMDFATLQCFASGSGNSADAINGIITLFALVFGILNIILFFKIWGMTDDIRALKKDHFCETQFESNAGKARFLRKNVILGNRENVKRILLQNFINNVEHAYGELKTGGYVKDDKGIDVWTEFKERNLKESIAPYVKNLMMQYAKIGEDVPVYITRMETFGDYFNLFVKEDFVVNVEKKVEEGKQE